VWRARKLIAQLALLAMPAAIPGAQAPYRSSASPITLTSMPVQKPVTSEVLAIYRKRLGVSKVPTSVRMAMLEDQQPFGDSEHRLVAVARYELVQVASPNDKLTAAAVNLTLVFDATTNDLVCAFTDPAPYWAESSQSSENPEEHTAKEGWVHSPAKYESLRSAITDVLAVVWKSRGMDPRRVGQIILRPRFVTNTKYKYVSDGRLYCPPSNVWIVEVLGTVVDEMETREGPVRLCTLVAHIRDGDLVVWPGSMW
jgi:hypothetical protein